MGNTIKNYYGKVILFGEYSMIYGSSALLIPLYTGSSHWDFIWRNPGKRNYASNRSLNVFYNYLKDNERFSEHIDIARFKTELKKGLFLDSSIPSGYGVGSSGALTAAVYDRFHNNEIEDPMELKRFLADMENCFHGNSSGLDPLQCYFGKPFILDENKKINILDENFLPENVHIFLIDSNIKSDTKSLVNYFNEKRNDPRYLKAYEELYFPYVSRCINSLVTGEVDVFFENLSKLSYYQTIMFEPMVTDKMMPLFSVKRDAAHFQIKLCGSGGGGYFLGFSDDKDATEHYMVQKGYPISWII
ncbi:MAG: hypothetical protein MJZ47_00675 [Bacteroidales bacterium]|nr:hypothetical protein [Bacteroidales bacterium]